MKIVSVSLPDELVELIDDIHWSQRIKRSALLREYIIDGLQRDGYTIPDSPESVEREKVGAED